MAHKLQLLDTAKRFLCGVFEIKGHLVHATYHITSCEVTFDTRYNAKREVLWKHEDAYF